jgi:hypothetical protein
MNAPELSTADDAVSAGERARREKIRRAHIGKIVSQETRQKQRDAHLGKKLSEENKERIRQSCRRSCGRWIRSEETRRKMRNARLGKKASEATKQKMRESAQLYAKPVVICGVRYDSISFARKITGLSGYAFQRGLRNGTIKYATKEEKQKGGDENAYDEREKETGKTRGKQCEECPDRTGNQRSTEVRIGTAREEDQAHV